MENLRKCTLWEGKHFFKLKVGNNKIDLFNIRKTCYHYTTLETFWKIIENDTFHATHVRFSNDEEEYTQGKKIIEGIIKDTLPEKPTQLYMICLCSGPNILSQWREYAQSGVSIGLDFPRGSLFSILPKDEKNDNDVKSFSVSSMPIDVLYTRKNKDSDDWEFASNDNHLLFTSEHLKNGFDTQKISETSILDTYKGLIPYIKHWDFSEEKEARLVFDLSDDEYNMNEFISYKDVNHIKRPYCKINYGDRHDSEKDCTYVSVGKNITCRTEIESKLKEHCPYLVEPPYLSETDYDHICISAGKNQHELFKLVEGIAKSISPEKEIKIFCDGHWPIRSVMVGPTANKKQIAENIKQFINNNYWLKYIDVGYSETPYREKNRDSLSTNESQTKF